MNRVIPDAPRVLIVDDEPDLCELLAITLHGMGLPSDSTGSVAAGKQALLDGTYRLCLCDLRLPDGSGLELIEHIQRTQPQLPVAMITAHGDVGAAVAAMKAGAFDFVNKPVNVQALAIFAGRDHASDGVVEVDVPARRQSQSHNHAPLNLELVRLEQAGARAQRCSYVTYPKHSGSKSVTRRAKSSSDTSTPKSASTLRNWLYSTCSTPTATAVAP